MFNFDVPSSANAIIPAEEQLKWNAQGQNTEEGNHPAGVSTIKYDILHNESHSWFV